MINRIRMLELRRLLPEAAATAQAKHDEMGLSILYLWIGDAGEPRSTIYGGLVVFL
jgi:hypothetical protein